MRWGPPKQGQKRGLPRPTTCCPPGRSPRFAVRDLAAGAGGSKIRWRGRLKAPGDVPGKGDLGWHEAMSLPLGDTSSLAGSRAGQPECGVLGRTPKQQLTWELWQLPNPTGAFGVTVLWHPPGWPCEAQAAFPLVLAVTVAVSLPGAGGRGGVPVSPLLCRRRGS